MNDPKSSDPAPSNPSPSDAKAGAPVKSASANNPQKKKELTPEEQMALYEEDLKETDWGHQPC